MSINRETHQVAAVAIPHTQAATVIQAVYIFYLDRLSGDVMHQAVYLGHPKIADVKRRRGDLRGGSWGQLDLAARH